MKNPTTELSPDRQKLREARTELRTTLRTAREKLLIARRDLAAANVATAEKRLQSAQAQHASALSALYALEAEATTPAPAQ
jgi:hypothetical protein